VRNLSADIIPGTEFIDLALDSLKTFTAIPRLQDRFTFYRSKGVAWMPGAGKNVDG
jgi:hypothetical protein